MISILTLIVTILSVIVIPLMVYAFKQYGELVALKTEVKNIKEFQSEYREDISKLFQKLDDLKDEIHSKSENYVHKDSCTGCKK